MTDRGGPDPTPLACANVRLTQLLRRVISLPSALQESGRQWLAYSAPQVAKTPREAIECRERSSRSPTTSRRKRRPPWCRPPPAIPTRMAFRIMLKTGLRVSEALALRRVDLRLDQDPPIIVVRADSPGNKARKGREVPVPADLALFHKGRQRPMLDISRWRLSQVMKETALQVGIDPARAHPPRLPAHLRPQLRAAGPSDPGAAEVAGPLAPQGHPALRGTGQSSPRMGKPAVSVDARICLAPAQI